MKKWKSKISGIMSKTSIRTQLYIIYIVAIFLPMIVVGSLLLHNIYGKTAGYYQSLLESENLRVRNILLEIMNQTYAVSEEFTYADKMQEILSTQEYPVRDMIGSTNYYRELNNAVSAYNGIDSITIYTDNLYACSYLHFEEAVEEIIEQDWYQRAMGQLSVFWTAVESADKYGNDRWYFCLVRQIPVQDSESAAVMVISYSTEYLTARINKNDYRTQVVGDDGRILFHSAGNNLGETFETYIDYSRGNYHYMGSIWENAGQFYADIRGLQMYRSPACHLYVVTMSESAYQDIYSVLINGLLLLLLAIFVPFLLIYIFSCLFTERVRVLRDEMKKASAGNYDIVPRICGRDELAEVFSDLQIMVTRIKEQNARAYQGQLHSEQLKNEQRLMELKMLASQINPHFLYNTLESIRMQALTAGNRDVANSIKLLGKSMHYVLENTGTSSISLQRELDYIENYLAIQRLRFGDRVNYILRVDEKILPEHYRILPFLLQPVIENAILHGLEKVAGNGRVELNIREQEGHLEMTVSDNGAGMTSEELQELRIKIRQESLASGRSIGLSNINRRICLCYGEDYGLRVHSAVGIGTDITLVLPIEIL